MACSRVRDEELSGVEWSGVEVERHQRETASKAFGDRGPCLWKQTNKQTSKQVGNEGRKEQVLLVTHQFLLGTRVLALGSCVHTSVYSPELVQGAREGVLRVQPIQNLTGPHGQWGQPLSHVHALLSKRGRALRRTHVHALRDPQGSSSPRTASASPSTIGGETDERVGEAGRGTPATEQARQTPPSSGPGDGRGSVCPKPRGTRARMRRQMEGGASLRRAFALALVSSITLSSMLIRCVGQSPEVEMNGQESVKRMHWQ